MRTITLATVAAGLFVGTSAVRAEDARMVLKNLQGTWTFARFERAGKDLTNTPQFKTAEVTIADDQFQSGEIVATLKFDPSQNPKAVDFHYTKGPFAGQQVKAIYKLDGDTITFARAAQEGDARPTEFSSTAENGQILAALQRAKPAATGAK